MFAALRSTRTLVVLAALVASGTLATHTVDIVPGDTLSEIAAETGVTVADLVAWNGIADADLIIAGESLVVEGGAGDGTAASYVVQPGDTLGALAGRLGSTVEALAAANDLSDPDHIVVGQILSSGAKAAGDGYTIEPGDTLRGIARAHGVRVTDLIDANSIGDPDRIVAGRQLTIPDGSTPPAETPSVEAPPVTPAVEAPTTTPPTTTVPPTTTTTPPTTTVPPTPTTTPPTTTVPPTPTTIPVAVPGSSSALTGYFDMWTAAYGVDRGLLEALVWAESGWQPAAAGPDGRLGIGQLSPDTIVFVEERLLGLDLDPLDASDGIRMAARYLRYLLDRTNDDREALAAWNQGLELTNTDGISASAAAFADEVLAIMSRRGSP